MPCSGLLRTTWIRNGGEETLVNAVYHRSYDISEPVEVRIHPDRIEILSFPGPDRSVRKEDIAAGNILYRRYRNRRIGEFLKELELTEGKATGIPKIKKAMRLNGSRDAVFVMDDDRNYFLAVLPAHPEFIPREQVSEQVLAILGYCAEPRSKQEILIHQQLKPVFLNYKRHIMPLVDAGLLEMTISDKPCSSRQRYKTTGRGLSLLRESKREHGGDRA